MITFVFRSGIDPENGLFDFCRCGTGTRTCANTLGTSTKNDASRFAHSVETEKYRGDWLDPHLAKVTFEEWAEEWLTQLGHLKPKTRRSYETSLRCHVLPLLGKAKVGTLDRSAIRRFVSVDSIC